MKQTDDPNDISMMLRAYMVAKANPDRTRNKAVGAILVNGGLILAEGFRKSESPHGVYASRTFHAEEVALLAAGSSALGATLYCTLEPCTIRAKHPTWYPSPPCCQLIEVAGVVRVVIGLVDDDFGSGGTQYLEKRGIVVEQCSGIDVPKFRALTQNETVADEEKHKLHQFRSSLG